MTLEAGHTATMFHPGTNTYYRATIIHAMTRQDVQAELAASGDEARPIVDLNAHPEHVYNMQRRELVVVDGRVMEVDVGLNGDVYLSISAPSQQGYPWLHLRYKNGLRSLMTRADMVSLLQSLEYEIS